MDNTHEKLQALGEYIQDTEDFINIELDSHRNDLFRVGGLACCSGVELDWTPPAMTCSRGCCVAALGQSRTHREMGWPGCSGCYFGVGGWDG